MVNHPTGQAEGNRTLLGPEAKAFIPPTGWACLPPGDAGLTRKVKAAGPTVTLQEKRGRKVFSLGVWADAEQIATATAEMEQMRSTEKYARQKQQAAVRREKKQEAYVEDFGAAILDFLNFAPLHQKVAQQFAKRVSDHATPVGSGTVARTERIPIQQRAEAAVIAWMRHQTTAYDQMKIARIKGKRREVRRELAAQSKKILASYRGGQPIPASCPLQAALEKNPPVV